MTDKKRILSSIAAVARQLGRTPSLLEFVALSGISKYSVSLIFPRWNDAVRATGLEPVRLKVRPEDGELLKDWGQTVRKRRTIPTRYAYRRQVKHDPRTLEERFGGWSSVPRAFRKFAMGKREWADVVALLLPACIARFTIKRGAPALTRQLGFLNSAEESTVRAVKRPGDLRQSHALAGVPA